jgi:hypothetical protein
MPGRDEESETDRQTNTWRPLLEGAEPTSPGAQPSVKNPGRPSVLAGGKGTRTLNPRGSEHEHHPEAGKSGWVPHSRRGPGSGRGDPHVVGEPESDVDPERDGGPDPSREREDEGNAPENVFPERTVTHDVQGRAPGRPSLPQVPWFQLLRYVSCSSVRTSIFTPIALSLSRAISLSIFSGTV